MKPGTDATPLFAGAAHDLSPCANPRALRALLFLARRSLLVEAAAVCFLSSGCARLQVGESHGGTESIEIATQYAQSVGQKTGFNTFEVYLTNAGRKPVTFASVRLNGSELQPPAGRDFPQALETVKVAGIKEHIKAPSVWEKGEATWWQFYPTAQVGPGQTVVLQVNLRNAPTFQQKLVVESSSTNYAVVVPRFRQPDRLITAVTYTKDYERMFVQHLSASRLKNLRLNGRVVSGIKRLDSPDPRTPSMVAFSSPFRITTGMPLSLKVEFEDGGCRQAVVRALSGITLDCPNEENQPPRPKEECQKLCCDYDPPVLMLPPDVACDDMRTGRSGASAEVVIPDREKNLRDSPSKLAAASYCTATFEEVWNIYGQMTDAVYSKPYRLGWGENPVRFFEEEENYVEKGRKSAQPRPFLWIPEPFKRSGRYLAPEELEVLAWMVLMRGGKGIRYHFWSRHTVEKEPDLVRAVTDLNKEIKRHEHLLSPLVLVSEQTLDETQVSGSPGGSVKVYTAWSGDQGILVMIRNLDYETAGSMGGQNISSLHAVRKSDMSIPVQVPPAINICGVSDVVTGETIPFERGSSLVLRMAELSVFRIVWLSQGRRAHGNVSEARYNEATKHVAPDRLAVDSTSSAFLDVHL